MRGKVLCYPLNDQIAGITPAYTGKSSSQSIVVGCIKDHPRICGEKHQLLTTINEGEGSPPHMRGKVFASGEQLCIIGITPAYAGKS